MKEKRNDRTRSRKARLSRAWDDGISDGAAATQRRPRRRGLEPVGRKAALLVEAGAKLKAHPRDVASNASILFMCVTDATAVESVVFGRDGLAAAPGAGKLVVDFSLIHPDAARDIAARLKAANGMAWVDAPRCRQLRQFCEQRTDLRIS
jgi:NAD binding domain of 6-phosphogluconate dehydrogenase